MDETIKDISMNYYFSKCKETAIYPDIGNNFTYVLLGLLGECGELSNIWKKKIRDNKDIMSDEIRNKLIYELGDIGWYFVMCCFELNINPSEVLEKNIKKLADRKERNTLTGYGD